MIHKEIRCDGCGTVGGVMGDAFGVWRAHKARDGLTVRGWVTGAKGGSDWCPKCDDARKRWTRRSLQGRAR